MSGTGGPGAAYAWTGRPDHREFPAVPRAESPDRGAISGAMDEAVQWTLEKTGALDCLDKVTGAPAELTAAAESWRARATDLREVANGLRTGAGELAEHWHGRSSEGFGTHMGHVVTAIDDTAYDMAQTAKILGQAAKECALAEETVIELLSDLIQMLIAELATSFILDLVTAGLATVVDALVSGAEVTAAVARIARISEKLAETLRKLQQAVKELKEAVRSGKSVKEVLAEARKVRQAASRVRTTAKALSGKEGKEDGLSLLQRQAVGQPYKQAAKLVDKAGESAGLEPKWKKPLEEYAKSDTGQRSVLQDGSEAPAPYRVDTGGLDDHGDPGSIERTFG
ncbi:WXG100 family type VII secretion target [Streptomyces sp. NPDC050161]|uniref:WXG100 family type VII secretion target n=1 Tax=Streptomyces sp. NPDC050161 TaxID=3365604 RepID=UPI0037A1578F